MCSPLIHSLWHTSKILKFNFLTQNFSLSLSLCVVGPDDVKHTKYFSLSLSLSSLCCVIYPRGRSSVHSSKRVTTGPNGLQRVRTGPVTPGSNGFEGGGRRKGQWHVYYLPTIILFISFIHKNFISLFIFLLSLSLSQIIHENIYI